MPRGELILDPGVLEPVATCELQGFDAVAAVGGRALLPWRRQWQRAHAAGVDAIAEAEQLGDERFAQAVVHLDKSRPGTWQDLATAWQHLEPDGALLLAGHNELGVRSAVKRLAQELEQSPKVLANRAHGRVARFVRDGGPGPTPPAVELVDMVEPAATTGAAPGVAQLVSAPGVFSAGRLDAGSKLLLDCLRAGKGIDQAPARVFDPGCGVGPLGLSALRLWPGSRAVLAEADARAVACARVNAERLGVAERCGIHWWDVTEAPPASACDLALVNPPHHRGKAVDLTLARAFFSAAAGSLRPGGSALVVANRKLPYEAELDNHGSVREIDSRDGFKVLLLTQTGAR